MARKTQSSWREEAAEQFAATKALLAEFAAVRDHGLYTVTPTLLTRAQIHATLAQAAAAMAIAELEGS
jgi:ribulose-5-phosphate 4-epimerase/fuculose-1-phosphate aldolase